MVPRTERRHPRDRKFEEMKMNEPRLTLLAIALSSTLSAGVAYSQAQTAPPTKKAPEKTAASATLSAQDRKFVNTAGEAGAAEVAMGQLAESHSASADVKGFAARVVSDHQKAGDELKSIAEAKGATPPVELSKKDQADLDKLSKLQGSDFDKAYIKTQLSAHRSAVALFGTESKSGKDAQLKQFASTTLPTLEDHLQMVQQLSKTTKS
jgi:putative membrane protein